MERALLRGVFSLAASCSLLSAVAQKDRFAYAVTGQERQGSDWNFIRKIDLHTGAYTDFLFDGTSTKAEILDAATRKPFAGESVPKEQSSFKAPLSSGVAAMAYDRVHHRLYFTPMFLGQLRYLDLRTQKLYYLTTEPLMSHNLHQEDGGKVVTRMVITPDGNGYAITNDGEHMARFTTGRNPKIVQMGGLIDAPENGGFSIHTRCTGYGGDMIADDEGNLLILTAQNHIYKVTPANRLTRYLGTIKGLPATFTVNGAVVDDAGKLLVSSGVDESDYYRVDPQTLEATPFGGKGIYRSSDLANGNYLRTRSIQPATELSALKMPAAKNSNNIQVYPNPATGGTITLQFHKVIPGDYNIDLVDVLGRPVQSQRTTIAFEGQTQTLTLPAASAKGVYLVRVLDRNRKLAHEEKVVVK